MWKRELCSDCLCFCFPCDAVVPSIYDPLFDAEAERFPTKTRLQSSSLVLALGLPLFGVLFLLELMGLTAPLLFMVGLVRGVVIPLFGVVFLLELRVFTVPLLVRGVAILPDCPTQLGAATSGPIGVRLGGEARDDVTVFPIPFPLPIGICVCMRIWSICLTDSSKSRCVFDMASTQTLSE